MNTLRLRSPADVVSAIPYLIGFHPSDSVVVLACDGSRGAYAIRLDVTAHDALLEHIADLVAGRRPSEVILAGYGEDARVTPTVERVRDRLSSRGVRLREALRIDKDRYWSYLCANAACCPPEGTYVDVRASPVAVTAIAGGLVALPDRRDLERLVAFSGGDTAVRATARAERRLAAWVDEGAEKIPSRMTCEGVPFVRRVVERAYAGEPPPDPDEVAWLGLLLVSLRVRDEAWVRMDEPRLNAHLGLWRHVLTHVTEPYTPAPACLLAFAAWRRGEGALANVALDRALAADPDYSMARLLQELFISGLPPWSLPMNLTPADLDDPA